MSTELLSDYDAIGVLDGFVECDGAEMYLRACKTKHGDEAAIDKLEDSD